MRTLLPSLCAVVLTALPGIAVAAPVEVRIEGARLVEVAEAALRRQNESRATRVELRAHHLPDAVLVPGDEVVTLRAECDPAELSPMQRAVVMVEQQGRVLRRVPLWFAVQAHAPGWLATRTLPAGHVLVESDLRPGEVDLAKLGLRESDAAPALLGKRLRVSVAEGRPVSSRHAQVLPDVLRGTAVTVELVQTGIRIAATGVALADAHLGNAVRIRMPREAVLDATVVGAQRVRLESGATP